MWGTSDGGTSGVERSRSRTCRGAAGRSVLAGTPSPSAAAPCVAALPRRDRRCGAGARRAPARRRRRRRRPQDASTTGITSNSVTVGNVSIISGPVPGLFEGAPIGVKAYFAYINSKGGVNGRKLIVDSKDDAFSGQQNATETQDADRPTTSPWWAASRCFDGYGCKSWPATPAVPDVSVTLDPGTNSAAQRLQRPAAGRRLVARAVPVLKKHYPKDDQGRDDRSRTRPRPRPSGTARRPP